MPAGKTDGITRFGVCIYEECFVFGFWPTAKWDTWLACRILRWYMMVPIHMVRGTPAGVTSDGPSLTAAALLSAPLK